MADKTTVAKKRPTTYTQYREQRQKEVNALPLFFAFSDSQFEKEMAKRNLTLSAEDLKKIVRVVNGGFCLKEDLPAVHAFFENDPLEKYMNNKTFARGAFLYEMRNHEYGINWQADWDVCSCFGHCEYGDDKDYTDYLKEMGYGDKQIQAYAAARATYYRTCKD